MKSTYGDKSYLLMHNKVLYSIMQNRGLKIFLKIIKQHAPSGIYLQNSLGKKIELLNTVRLSA